MSSLFNYELDERQIRLTLHDADLDSCSVSWAEFDAAYPGHVNKATKLPPINFPKVSMSINRNVLIPLFFIIALGSVSAILFRFVNFKTNKPVEVEKALLPDAAAYSLKTEKKDAPAPAPKEKKVIPPVKTTVLKDTTPIAAKAAVSSPTPAPQPVVQNPVAQNVARMPVSKPVYTSATNVQKPAAVDSAGDVVVQKPVKTDSSAAVVSSPRTDTNSSYDTKGRKRNKKVTADQIESMKAPTTLISTQTAETDPEPELRLQ